MRGIRSADQDWDKFHEFVTGNNGSGDTTRTTEKRGTIPAAFILLFMICGLFSFITGTIIYLATGKKGE